MSSPAITPTNTKKKLIGCEVPRIYTPPLRELTPETSHGFALIAFAEFIGQPFFPWQKWLAIHALELNEDNETYRFRIILLLVARQNGKTHFMKVLALWRMFIAGARLVLGVAQSLTMALETYCKALEMVQEVPELVAEFEKEVKSTGDRHFWLKNRATYKVRAANRKSGRGLSVDLLMLDELREQKTWEAWAALAKTTSARPMGQVLCASNAGDDESVVLNHLRDVAVVAIDYEGADDEEDIPGIFEWSAPDGCALDDTDAWRQANPSLGYTLKSSTIRADMRTDPAPVFRTEVLCQRVLSLDAPVDAAAWASCGDANAPLLDSINNGVTLCVDVSPDGAHVTCVAAVHNRETRKTHVEVMGFWNSTEEARDELRDVIRDVGKKIIAVGWFSSGPASRLSSEIRNHGKAVEVKGASVSEACQEAVDLITGRRIVHTNDPLLTAHLTGASRLMQGDTWRFYRKGVGYCDAAYAFAGAVYLAINAPEPRKRRASAIY